MKDLTFLKHIPLFVFMLLLLTLPAIAQGKSDKAQKDHVVIGNVEQVTNNSLMVEDKKRGRTEESIVDRNTKIVGQDRKLLRLRQIKPKDMVAVISSESGEATEDGKIKHALKVFVKDASSSAEMKRKAVMGIIQSIDGSLITLVHQIHRDRVYMVLTDANTVIKSKNKVASGSASLQIGQRIAVIGDLQEDGKLLARRIHIIPGLAKGVFKKFPLATPSAELSATPTATETPTLTPTLTATPSATPSASPTP